jgi:thiamine-phosphate pyrophosphorylase
MTALPRVYPILDGACLCARNTGMTVAAEALLEAGMRILQFRWKNFFSRQAYAQAERIRDLCAAADVQFVMNDRADYAAVLRCGLHLGQDDLPPAAARALVGGPTQVGLSTHNEAQFLAAHDEPVDYVAIGPIFGTTTKEKPDPRVGLAELARLRRQARKPVVAIGGITRENAASVWRVGADSVAVVADLYPQECSKASIRHRAEEWLKLSHD